MDLDGLQLAAPVPMATETIKPSAARSPPDGAETAPARSNLDAAEPTPARLSTGVAEPAPAPAPLKTDGAEPAPAPVSADATEPRAGGLPPLEVQPPRLAGEACLNSYQEDVIAECLGRREPFGIVALPMGAGKTLIGLMLAQLHGVAFGAPALWVCSKTLLQPTVLQLRRFFQDRLPFQELPSQRTDNPFVLAPTTRVVFTTPAAIRIAATQFRVGEDVAVPSENNTIHYVTPAVPLRQTGGPPATRGLRVLFARRWAALVMDEAQDYMNCSTATTRAVAGVVASRRWILSGTVLTEPKPCAVLGLGLLLHAPGARTLPDTRDNIRGGRVRPLRGWMVHRATNPAFTAPVVRSEVVTHALDLPEQAVFQSFRAMLQLLMERRDIVDERGRRAIARHIFTTITSLRQALVAPVIPVTSLFLVLADQNQRSQLASMMLRLLNEGNLQAWLSDPASICGSRMRAVLKVLQEHVDRKAVVFSCFAEPLHLLQHLLEERGHAVYRLEPSMTSPQRAQLLLDFEAHVGGGVLLTTYTLGAQGLNLQMASVALMLDFWWNDGYTAQAEARVLRMGQQAREVSLYYFASNTGLEQGMFQKQMAKRRIADHLMDGTAVQVKVPKLSQDQMIEMILSTDDDAAAHPTDGADPPPPDLDHNARHIRALCADRKRADGRGCWGEPAAKREAPAAL